MDNVNTEKKKRGRPAGSGNSPSFRVRKYRLSQAVSGKKQVSLYLSAEVLEQIDLQATNEAKNRSDVVEKIIRKVLFLEESLPLD